MMATSTLTTQANERYLNGIGTHCIHNEKYEFNFDSDDEEDEVFFGDNIGFKEKCQSAVVNDLCDFQPIAELTDEQWIHMKEQADNLIYLLWEEKKNYPNSPAVAATAPSSRNIMQSPQITSSPAMSTRSKRKMQLISNSPYKISPLKDITNRSVTKPSPGIITPQSIKKLAPSKLDTSTDLILYEQLGLVNPVRLNFDDVEHSPKKNRCLEPCFTSQDSPLITDEACSDVLMSSPDVKQTKTVRESLGLNQNKAVRESLLGLNPRMSLDAKLKSRIRSKTVTLNESSILLPSRPSIPSSNPKSKISSKGKDKSCEPKLKSPRKSILNVSFTIDKKSEALLGIATTPTESSENKESSEAKKDKQTLNESFTINKSQGRESVLNESFTINKSYVRDSAGGRPSLNESFTINKSIVRDSLVGKSTSNDSSTRNSMNIKSTLNESFTVNDQSTRSSMNRKSVLNESFTINDQSTRSSMNGKSNMNESFTVNDQSTRSSMNGKSNMNESFTVNDQSTRSSMNGKSNMNESFTVNDQSTRSSMNGKSNMNESFTVNDQSTRSSMNGKSNMNESFTVNDQSTRSSMNGKSNMNESFTVNDQSTRSSMNGKSNMNESFTVNDQSTRSSMNGKSTLNESFTINDQSARSSMTRKSVLNESFTINDQSTRSSMNGKSTLNESFTINDQSTRSSMNGKSTLNESFTINDQSALNSMNGKSNMNESFTVNDQSTLSSMNRKSVLNESFTTENSYVAESIGEQPTLNESFTIDDCQSVDTSIGKPVLNGSFTVNESQLEGVNNENSTMNESFMMKTDSQITEVSTKKPVLNESFTLEKSTLNTSFPVDSSVDNSHLDTSSTKVAGNTSKKKSPPGRLNASLINKSTTGDKSSRKRTLGTPTRQGNEPPSKTTVFSRSELNKRQVPTIKSSIGPKSTISRLQPSKTNFSITRPNMAFEGSSSTLSKDKHGMVKFEEKSKVPEKKPKSSLLLPSKLTRKSLKVSPKKPILKKEEPKVQSPVMRPKRKCIQSTPPISRIGSIKPVESSLNGNASVPKTRLVLPSKLPSNIGKPMSQSRIPNKGPLRAFPTVGKVSEVKPSEGSHLPFAGKSKLRMPSPVKSRIPYINFKPT